MRLWHQELIAKLPRQQLLGQHRECCALRGKGWQRKHATVNYVFDYSPYRLFKYHELIMQEMTKRGYRVSPEWLDKEYRASRCQPTTSLKRRHYPAIIYPEHWYPPIYRNVWTISSKRNHHLKEKNDAFVKWLAPKKKAAEGLVMRISTADQVDYATITNPSDSDIWDAWCNFQYPTIVSILHMEIKSQWALSLLSTRMTSTVWNTTHLS